MKLEGSRRLVRIFVGEQDRWRGRPLYEAIVDEARALGLAGATVFKGVMGYGAKAHLHTAKLLELSYDMPMVIEIVDSAPKVAKLLPKLKTMVSEGLVTIEKAHVIVYRADPAAARSSRR